MGALRTGVIRPRGAIDARLPEAANSFDFDFHLPGPGPDSTFDAYFPHSSHTQWVACLQCHNRIFRYRGTPIRMHQVLAGQYCGECHGKVSFPVLTGCDRCHPALKLPEGWAKPDLIGEIVLRRMPPDSSYASGVAVDSLPPARFPHWIHRIRYKCSVCHIGIFEARAGANVIRMKDITEGRSCGACHDGKTAFRAGFGECQRCHVRELVDATSP